MVAQNRDPRSFDRLLAELAALWGVQTGYRDARGRWTESPREAVVQVLEALGAGFDDGLLAGEGSVKSGGAADERRLRHAIELKKADMSRRLVEPVLVAWDGVLPSHAARPAAAGAHRPVGGAHPQAARGEETTRRRARATSSDRVELALLLEGGGELRWEPGWEEFRAGSSGPGFGGPRRARLPFGYHRLRVEAGSLETEATVISAPRRCWAPEQASAGRPDPAGAAASGGAAAGTPSRQWGVFAPLYALRTERDWGAGDLADLGALRDLVADAGGSAVATLPLLAGYLDRPFEPCPYSAVSRLFWNEFYLAVDQISEWESCAAARATWGSTRTQERLARLRAAPLVEYAEVMALKRRVLEDLCRCFFSRAGSERKEAFAAYVRAHPEALHYAAFRARVEARGADWRSWPDDEAVVAPELRTLTEPPEAERYHLYCQWQMEEQLDRLSSRDLIGARGGAGSARRAPPGLFLDLPVGVHPGGFDAWRWRGSFVAGMSTGAPPDSFFTRGQDWDSPPLHPERIREQGHRYFVLCLQEHMRHARFLRIDHVMSLHRLFWVPEGREPGEGVYVTYPAEELYAALCLESRRHHTVVVGEDLGTVPAGVRASMRRHGVLSTWVLQSSLKPRAVRPVGKVPRHVVAALGTHDMFPFAGFLRGDDVSARMEMGQLDQEGARRETAERRRLVTRLTEFLTDRVAARAPVDQIQPAQPGMGTPAAGPPAARTPAGLLRSALAYLGESQAPLVLVNLEDLLLETRPQNLPGTGLERGNWRRKMAGTVAELERAIALLRQPLRTAVPPSWPGR